MIKRQMIFEDAMIRLVIGSILLIAPVAPAFAEKVTLSCPHDNGPASYYTFDSDSHAVTFDPSPGNPSLTVPVQMTDTEVTWRWHGTDPDEVFLLELQPQFSANAFLVACRELSLR